MNGMQRVSITGHTKGIGKSVADNLKNDYEVLGFSRSTGYNITKPVDRNRIFEESQTCDIFINNAFCRDAQLELFTLFYDAWHNDSSKTIININSLARLGAINSLYKDMKCNLHNKWLTVLHSAERKCKIINLSPGFVDTEMINTLNVPESIVMQPEEFADFVRWVLTVPSHIEISELSFWRRV